MLLTQPVPRHSSKHVLEEYNFERAHNTQPKAEKEEEKGENQQAILLISAKSVELLRKEDELKKVNAALQHVLRRQQEQAKINQAEIKEKEEARSKKRRKLVWPNY